MLSTTWILYNMCFGEITVYFYWALKLFTFIIGDAKTFWMELDDGKVDFIFEQVQNVLQSLKQKIKDGSATNKGMNHKNLLIYLMLNITHWQYNTVLFPLCFFGHLRAYHRFCFLCVSLYSLTKMWFYHMP